MLREIVGKVVRNTPGLRRLRDLVRGGADKAQAAPPADTGPRYGAESPRAESPRAEAPRAEAPRAQAPKAAAAVAPSSPPPAVVAAESAAPAPADTVVDATPSAPKKGAKKAGAKKAGAKGASEGASPEPADAGAQAAAPAPAQARPAAAKEEHARKDQAEVEALRAEAERKKAEIRARKEAEAKATAAPAPAPAAGGIAALIAQAGGKVESVGAKTNVRATSGIDWEPEDTDVHLADDGVEYWGAIDNESSRAFARGDTLIIDQWECINCGTCVENTEHVFVLPTDAKAVVISQEGPMDLIQDAIDACPVTCIHWTDNPGQFEQINDAEGNPLS